LEICPEATVGKVLIQRNEETAQPMLYYSKLPPLEGKSIVVLDPMVATGGSAICAIQVLVDHGADPSNMFFFNVVSCPEGLAAMTSAFPGKYFIQSFYLLTRSAYW
jgi:uracil phosphoribosyltransferase